MTAKALAKLAEKMVACDIPAHMRQGLLDYIDKGTSPGSFLTAVLSNDLKTAVLRGDDLNVNCLAHYVYFLYNYCPAISWGNAENVAAWMKERRAEKSA